MSLRSITSIIVALLSLVSVVIVLSLYAGLEASLLWTGLIGGLGWAIQSSVQTKREYARLLADKKRQHYLEFLDFLNIFFAEAKSHPESSKKSSRRGKQPSADELRKWSLRLTLIGSDEVVRAYNQARVSERDADDPNDVSLLRDWGEVWLAMRRDCGHIDTDLTRSDILASVVNDISTNRDKIDT